MVCHGPDPTDSSPHELTPPPRHDLVMNGNPTDDSDDERNEYFGYEPLPQGPEAAHSERSDDDSENSDEEPAVTNVPNIEAMENVLVREVWNTPHPTDSIQMDVERAEQVMSAMANFVLPQTSIPEWAHCVSEDQWKQTLHDRIEKLKNNR